LGVEIGYKYKIIGGFPLPFSGVVRVNPKRR